jgi:hypothetical protein
VECPSVKVDTAALETFKKKYTTRTTAAKEAEEG